MKNRKLVYVLLPATLAVWILIGVRIYKTLHPAADAEQLAVRPTTAKPAGPTLSDTFLIANNYRDPFGKVTAVAPDRHYSAAATAPAVKKAAPPATSVIKAESWPAVSYSGMIRNQQSNKQLALVSINGNLHSMKQGDITDHVQLGKIWKDSIEVVWNKERKFVRK